MTPAAHCLDEDGAHLTKTYLHLNGLALGFSKFRQASFDIRPDGLQCVGNKKSVNDFEEEASSKGQKRLGKELCVKNKVNFLADSRKQTNEEIDLFMCSNDCRFLSDHRPILLRESAHDYGPVPFRFFHHWIHLEGFNEVRPSTLEFCPFLLISNGMRNVGRRSFEQLDAVIDKGTGTEVEAEKKNGGVAALRLEWEGSMTRASSMARDSLKNVEARLSKWNPNIISMGGRLTLLKSVLGSIQSFTCLFQVPSKFQHSDRVWSAPSSVEFLEDGIGIWRVGYDFLVGPLLVDTRGAVTYPVQHYSYRCGLVRDIANKVFELVEFGSRKL
ncbi:hypothetical protein Tco_0098762 [Tanacetum coccineum]